jgi:hypothetical protein
MSCITDYQVLYKLLKLCIVISSSYSLLLFFLVATTWGSLSTQDGPQIEIERLTDFSGDQVLQSLRYDLQMQMAVLQDILRMYAFHDSIQRVNTSIYCSY